MSSLDWPSVDANGVSLPTIVSSSDLFDGELFGDELMDIYNSAVVGETSEGDHNGKISEASAFAKDLCIFEYTPDTMDPSVSRSLSVISTEIPNLLSPHNASDGLKHESEESIQIAAAAAAIDDGLGAFRPSTSFSDLTTLLNPSAAEATPETAPATTAEVPKPTKKRAVSSNSLASQTAAPAPKRKATGEKANTPKAVARRVSTSSKKSNASQSKTAAAASSTSKSFVKYVPAEKTDSATPPDPLSAGAKAAAVASGTKEPTAKTTKKSAVPKATSDTPTPAVVSSSAAKTAPSISPVSSEADFKSIAQVAVSNLIMTAASSKKESAAQPAAKENNRARRQNLTPDERARQNRDRNREHARNTRLRKKAYVEELKRTLTELVSQRDAAEFEKRQSAQRELEQREVRFRVTEEFLKLRGRNETNFARWAAILEDGFSLTIPLTDYRKTVKTATKSKFDQVLQGVSDVMSDSAMFSEYLQSLGSASGKGAVTFQYNCERSNFFMDGCNAVLEWTATSVGAVTKVSTFIKYGSCLFVSSSNPHSPIFFCCFFFL